MVHKCSLLLKGFLFVLIFLLFFNSSRSVAEDEIFTIETNSRTVGFEDNPFSVYAPEKGVLYIYIKDDYHLYRVICEKVNKGLNIIIWDGCGYNKEKMLPGEYKYSCKLQGESGKEYTYEFSLMHARNAQYIQFVLPSAPAVYLSDPGNWFLEVKTVKDGNIILDFYPNGSSSSVLSVRVPVHIRKVEHFTFDKLLGNKSIDTGSYIVHVYDVSRPDLVSTFQLEIYPGSPEESTVFVTGDIMPTSDADDAEIWNIMMNPAVVLNSDYNYQQKVYAEPDMKSKSLGTIHGQTQCLSVLTLEDEWAKIGAWNHEDASYIEGWIPSSKLTIVDPSDEYGLLIDKKNQTLAVFHEGKRIETIPVSTGRMSKYYYHRETSAGCYVTGLHRVDFSMQGNKYDYVIQYDGGNLLHQIPYSSDGKKYFTIGKALLGAKASHACIRIPCDPGPETGINAYWIWTHIPYQTKIIILDDPEERIKEKAILQDKTPLNNSEELTPVRYDDETFLGETITITFGGNVTIGGTENSYNLKSSFGSYLEQYGMEYPFSKLYKIFSSDDLTCINLDCVLKENKSNEDKSKSVRLRGLPEYAEILTAGSVEMVCLSNDHVWDYGEEGYQSTIYAVENKTKWVGKDQPCVVKIKGYHFGFGACHEKDYLSDPDIIQKDIIYLKENDCRFIIYLCCWGDDNDNKHNNIQEAMARACERAGADLVIGFQQNQLQGVDYINGMPVVYGLGKLMQGSAVAIRSFDSVLVRATFYPDHPDRNPEIGLIPVISSSLSSEGINNFQPNVATENDRLRIMNHIQKDTAYDISDFECEIIQ